MPYDEQGNFIYPLPARKSRPPASPATPKKRPAASQPAVLSSPAPGVTTPPATSASPEILPLNPEPAETKPARPVPAAPVPASQASSIDLLPPETANQPLLTIQEGNNRWQMSENDLALVWNAQLWPENLRLRTTGGPEVEVVYRGRWSGGFGPDFKGAMLRVGPELLKGDVELHLRSGDWNLHGHHTDPRYNEVILQVTLEDNGPAVTTAQGRALPVLALLPLFREGGLQLQKTLEAARQSGARLGSLSESEGPCCDRVAEHHAGLSQVLDKVQRLGEQRFEEKAARFEAACAADPDGEESAAAQELWAGLLEALGYSQNKEPFRRLAAVLPLSLLAELDRESRTRRESAEERLLTLETVLLGGAGLLPSQRKPKTRLRIAEPPPPALDWEAPDGPTEDFIAERYTAELESRWTLLERQLRHLLPGSTWLSQDDWTFARLRPPNHPARRLAGLARLLVGWQLNEAVDLLEKFKRAVFGPIEGAASRLNALLRAEPGDQESDSGLFWTRRYDFGDRALMVGSNQAAGVELIGESRAADMVLNIVLPFLAGYGRDKRDPRLVTQTLAVYRAHPPLSRNELIENVGRQVFRYWLENPGEAVLEGKPLGKVTIARLANTACRQQGLIHLHHHFCAEQAYSACPLG
jgi:hypothetical protein